MQRSKLIWGTIIWTPIVLLVIVIAEFIMNPSIQKISPEMIEHVTAARALEELGRISMEYAHQHEGRLPNAHELLALRLEMNSEADPLPDGCFMVPPPGPDARLKSTLVSFVGDHPDQVRPAFFALLSLQPGSTLVVFRDLHEELVDNDLLAEILDADGGIPLTPVPP